MHGRKIMREGWKKREVDGDGSKGMKEVRGAWLRVLVGAKGLWSCGALKDGKDGTKSEYIYIYFYFFVIIYKCLSPHNFLSERKMQQDCTCVVTAGAFAETQTYFFSTCQNDILYIIPKDLLNLQKILYICTTHCIRCQRGVAGTSYHQSYIVVFRIVVFFIYSATSLTAPCSTSIEPQLTSLKHIESTEARRI